MRLTKYVSGAGLWGLGLTATLACSTDLDTNYAKTVIACERAALHIEECCRQIVPAYVCDQREAYRDDNGCSSTYYDTLRVAIEEDDAQCIEDASCSALAPHCDDVLEYLGVPRVACESVNGSIYDDSSCSTPRDEALEGPYRLAMEVLCGT